MPQITIRNVEVEHIAKGKTGYDKATVAYVNDRGENKEKGVMSFSNPAVFAAVRDAKSGDKFEVSFVKDDKYFNWATATPVAAGAAPVNQVNGTPARSGGTYETAEERKVKQLLIVKQSCLAQAIEYYKHPSFGEAVFGEDHILSLAQQFVDWVYGTDEALGKVD